MTWDISMKNFFLFTARFAQDANYIEVRGQKTETTFILNSNSCRPLASGLWSPSSGFYINV